ncbi:MAG: hypothetical protein ACXAC5_00140 [Promethearchaeota archaeon]
MKLVNIGTVRNFNLVPEETVEFYITLADSQIDGILTQMYFTPFDRCAHGEWMLDDDINLGAVEGTDVGTDTSGTPDSSLSQTVVVDSAVNLVPGDEVLLHDNPTGIEEVHIVASIVDQNTFTTEDPIVGTFLADNEVRVIRTRFPPPLNQISARLSASFIYDKFFAAQAQPNVSDYGKEMRAIAMGQMNDILNGKIIVKCGDRRGDIFGNPWLSDTYAHQDRGYNTSERDMSKPQ